MKFRTMIALAGLLVAGLAGPGEAKATSIFNVESCTSFNVCLDFDLAYISDAGQGWAKYHLTVTYVQALGADVPGRVATFGMWDGVGLPDYAFKDVMKVDGSGTWSFYMPGRNPRPDCAGLNGMHMGVLFEACADEEKADGLRLGEWVTISFLASPTLTKDGFDAEEYGAGAHVRGYGEADCSFFVNTSEHRNVEDGVEACLPAPTSVVPEPVSMVLMGSGLLGLGAMRRRRRNRGDDPAE